MEHFDKGQLHPGEHNNQASDGCLIQLHQHTPKLEVWRQVVVTAPTEHSDRHDVVIKNALNAVQRGQTTRNHQHLGAAVRFVAPNDLVVLHWGYHDSLTIGIDGIDRERRVEGQLFHSHVGVNLPFRL